LAKVIGWDIGGANTKATFLATRDGKMTALRTASKYFPMWKKPEELNAVLSELRNQVSGSDELDCVGVTMTAELSDTYRTKREGVNHVLAQVVQAFPLTKILVVDVNAELKSLEEAKANPLSVAAANWAATGWMVSKLLRNCIVIDVGSTTTSIIPIVEGSVSAAGKTDLEKLIDGELVYTGSLRTNAATIVNSVPLEGGVARVSSELFAQTGDVHLVLGNIKEEDYTVETADGKGKTRAESLARLARLVCADTETLSEDEIVQIANYVYEKQVEQITEGLSQVYSRVKRLTKREIAVVVTGLGRNFLGRKAAIQVGLNRVVDLGELVKRDIAKVSTAVGVALMTASKLEGRPVQWTQ